jgi:hypothetical protein
MYRVLIPLDCNGIRATAVVDKLQAFGQYILIYPSAISAANIIAEVASELLTAFLLVSIFATRNKGNMSPLAVMDPMTVIPALGSPSASALTAVALVSAALRGFRQTSNIH